MHSSDLFGEPVVCAPGVADVAGLVYAEDFVTAEEQARVVAQMDAMA